MSQFSHNSTKDPKKNFITIRRTILDWEWYDDINCTRLFIHCLLKANWKKKEWHGITIERGTFVTSTSSLSKETNLSSQQVRTSLSKLKLTGELTSKTTNKHTVIMVTNYNLYQPEQQANQQTDNQQVTNNQQTDNKQITTTNKEKKEKKEKNVKNEKKQECEINFEKARKLYKGKKRGHDTEFENFKKKHRNWIDICDDLLHAVSWAVKGDDTIPKFISAFQTFINNSGWEVYLEQEKAEIELDKLISGE